MGQVPALYRDAGNHPGQDGTDEARALVPEVEAAASRGEGITVSVAAMHGR